MTHITSKAILASLCMLACASSFNADAQGYQFKTVVSLKATPVKNQASTGTCWCFATTSFMESELLRMGKGEYDLSEMFIVRQKYLNQMEDNFILRGKGNVGQGSLSHTWMNAFNQVGIVPEEVYHGINYNSPTHSHGEMQRFIQSVAETGVSLKKRSPEYYKIANAVLDTYLGEVPEKFTYKGKEYTPKTFAASLGLNMDDYVEITSFSHHPFYKPMVLEIPDNWEHASQYNVPLDELIETMDYALNHGYTVCWDGDVSESGFSHANGVAINPDVQKIAQMATDTDRARFEGAPQASRQASATVKFDKPYPEVQVTQEIRQAGFENFSTTDDHLMHVTGMVKDQNGTKYYITKNSWGTDRSEFGGYLNISESYTRAKVMYIMVHKDAVPAALRAKLGF